MPGQRCAWAQDATPQPTPCVPAAEGPAGRGRAGLAGLLITGMLIGVTPPLDARPLRPGETVLDRPRPEMTRHGGRLGRLWVRPRLTTALAFDDNVLGNDAERVSDLLLRTAPDVVAETDWRGHRVSLSASAEQGTYRAQSRDNYLDLEAQAYGRLQATRRLHASATTRWTRGHVPRRATESPTDASEPTVYHSRSGETRVGYEDDVRSLSLRLHARALDYDDVAARSGDQINNDDRDRWIGVVELEERSNLTPDLERFTRSRINVRQYFQQIDDQGYARDSYGHATVGGLTWRPTGLTTLEAYGGARQQIYADPRFNNLLLPTAGLRVTTSPSQLTSIHLALGQSVRETTEPGASGRLVTELSARIDHELRRDLLAGLKLRYARSDYRGIDRRAVDAGAGVTLTYLASRHLHARVSVQHTRRRSDRAAGRSFTRNRIELGLELRY